MTVKKVYETPAVEKIEFQYRDQVVAASAGCMPVYENVDANGDNLCDANGVYKGMNN